MDSKEWVKTGEHLPEPLRDFFFCGYLFQWIDTAVEEKNKDRVKWECFQLPGAIAAHIYTVDFFLLFMGRFGYTLQKEQRNDVEFYDLEKTIGEFKKELLKKYLPSLPNQEGEEE